MAIDQLVQSAADNLQVDDRFSWRDLVELAREVDAVKPEDLRTAQLPVHDLETVQGAQVLELREIAARPLLRRFDADLPELMPEDIELVVLNATAQTGAARETADRLESFGFVVPEVGNADDRHLRTTLTVARGETDIVDLVTDALEDDTIRGHGGRQPGDRIGPARPRRVVLRRSTSQWYVRGN